MAVVENISAAFGIQRFIPSKDVNPRTRQAKLSSNVDVAVKRSVVQSCETSVVDKVQVVWRAELFEEVTHDQRVSVTASQVQRRFFLTGDDDKRRNRVLLGVQRLKKVLQRCKGRVQITREIFEEHVHVGMLFV